VMQLPVDWNPVIETLPQEKIRQLQLKKFKNIFQWTYNHSRFHKQLYDKAPIPYHTLSPDGIITNVNEKWCNTFNYKKEEVVGKSIFDFVIDEAEDQGKEPGDCRETG